MTTSYSSNQQKPEDLIRAVRVFRGRPDLENVVSHWKKPLLVVCGDHDRIVTEAKTAALAASARSGVMRVIRGCAHYMNLERPAEFNRIIDDFVRSV